MWFFSFFRKNPGQDARAIDDGPAPASAPAPATSQSARAETSPSPDEVRRLLFDAVAAHDEARLDSLCREHKALILRHASDWLSVPEALLSNDDARDWYTAGLRVVARFCADRLRRLKSS
jgi:hypothetical protein